MNIPILYSVDSKYHNILSIRKGTLRVQLQCLSHVLNIVVNTLNLIRLYFVKRPFIVLLQQVLFVLVPLKRVLLPCTTRCNQHCCRFHEMNKNQLKSIFLVYSTPDIFYHG